MVLLPNDWMLCWKERWKPFTSATIPITVPTPMTMPSSARTERNRLATRAWPAMRRDSLASRRFTLFVPQRFDRVEARRTPGGIGTEEDPDHRRHQDAGDDRGHAHHRRQR